MITNKLEGLGCGAAMYGGGCSNAALYLSGLSARYGEEHPQNVQEPRADRNSINPFYRQLQKIKMAVCKGLEYVMEYFFPDRL